MENSTPNFYKMKLCQILGQNTNAPTSTTATSIARTKNRQQPKRQYTPTNISTNCPNHSSNTACSCRTPFHKTPAMAAYESKQYFRFLDPNSGRLILCSYKPPPPL